MEFELEEITNIKTRKTKISKYYLNRKIIKKEIRNFNYEVNSHEYKKNNYLRCVYKITLNDYNNMLRNQNESCAICKKHKSNFSRMLSVDHCHNTGKIRGLLCAHCNHGLGKFKDNIKILECAINYLKYN